MARILYGVCGEGFGHSSRAREIGQHLIDQGHEIKILSYGKGFENLLPYFNVEKIAGLRLEYKNNAVSYLPTIFKNLLKAPQIQNSLRHILRAINQFKPQLVFSDFEPISALAANLKKLPLISIDNQHIITNTEIDYPKQYRRSAEAAKAVVKLMIFNARAYLVTAFFQAQPLNRKIFLFPPILRSEIHQLKPTADNFVLVYLTSQFTGLMDILERVSARFVVYGFDKSAQTGNLTFKKFNPKEFLKDLAQCQGVIANAGFTLITESLYLGKPYLALPVAGQFEQILNAYQLQKLGYGVYWDKLNKERVESFLLNLGSCGKNLRQYKKEDNSRIFKEIDGLIRRYA